mmetsp:Transcript_22703/g.51354  ORF Transcript_22703/g.51354 Transcript_22703/m.51354 type:complete len:460 (-) Transcript_22703:1262-2641(-)
MCGDLDEELDGRIATWLDVLSLIDGAADAIIIGDLIYGERYDLQESMSALEIMDPQMDSGMHVATHLETAQASLVPPPESPSHELLVGVLDELLCGEHGWYSGLPLSSTVFRLDWMHDAPMLSCLPLRASLLAAARTSAAFRSIVCRADIHEEEDFQPSIAGAPLHEGISDSDVLELLNQAEKVVQEEIRELKAARVCIGELGTLPSSSNPAATGSAGCRPTDAVPGPAKFAGGEGAEGSASNAASGLGAVVTAEAVLSRLRYRRGMLAAVSQMVRPSPRSMEGARKMLAYSEAQLTTIIGSVELGLSAAELNATYACAEGQRSRGVLGSAPRGKVELLSRTKAAHASSELIQQLRAVCAIIEVKDFDGFCGWRSSISTERGVPCGIVPRSSAYLLGVSGERSAASLRPPMEDIIADAIGSFNSIKYELWRQETTARDRLGTNHLERRAGGEAQSVLLT